MVTTVDKNERKKLDAERQAAGKAALSQLINEAREELRFSSWEAYADHLSRESGLDISKDVLHRAGQGFYSRQPNLELLYGIWVAGGLRLKDEQRTPVDFETMVQILLGFRAIDGSLIELSPNTVKGDSE